MSLPARARFREFHDLIRFRILDVILVATPYDKFVLEDAGELAERLTGEFRNLDLHYPPGITSVTTGEEAIALARQGTSGKLIITTPNVRDMDPATLARLPVLDREGSVIADHLVLVQLTVIE